MRPAGLEPTHPNKRGTGLSFRRVYHSTTGAKASQSRRTTGNYRSIISHPPARAQAEKRDPTPPKQTPHRTHTAKARGTTMLRGPCRTRTCDLRCNLAYSRLYDLVTKASSKSHDAFTRPLGSHFTGTSTTRPDGLPRLTVPPCAFNVSGALPAT